MQKANFDELIAQLAAATDGSEALDKEIAAYWSATIGRVWFTPPWTRSLDAALTLVPDEHTPALFQATKDRWHAEVRAVGVSTHIDWPPHYVTTHAKTAALALCIACLRALA